MRIPIIELKECSKRYLQGDQIVDAISATTLRIFSGEYLSIMGPSGSGKSTLLNLMGCLDLPSGGDVLIKGTSVFDHEDKALSKIRAETIGFIFQQFHLIPHLNVLDNVMLPFQYRTIPADRCQSLAENALRIVGLEHRMLSAPNTLSGGEMQRVAIARAIVGKPAVVLADEPTGSLDRDNAISIMRLLDKLNKQGTAFVVVTHDPRVAERASRRIICSNSHVNELSDEYGN